MASKKEWIGGLAAPSLLAVIVVLPNTLLAALAVLIKSDIPMSDVALGTIVSCGSAAAALFSTPGGRIAERIGAGRAMTICAIASGGALASLGLFANTYQALLILMIITGLSSALAMPSTNLAVARRIKDRYLGLALSTKQAAAPFAMLIAGASVPVIALSLGWRTTYVLMATLSLLFLAISRQDAENSSSPRMAAEISRPSKSLLLLAVSGALAVSAAMGAITFFIPAATQNGVSLTTASTIYSIGAVAGILGRIAHGWFADRRRARGLFWVSISMMAGVPGFLVVSVADSTLVLALGALLMFGAGWGWNGLYLYSIVRLNEAAPAAATGVTSTGMRVGGVIGPVLFGFLADSVSYQFAWVTSAVLMATASATVVAGRRAARLERRTHT